MVSSCKLLEHLHLKGCVLELVSGRGADGHDSRAVSVSIDPGAVLAIVRGLLEDIAIQADTQCWGHGVGRRIVKMEKLARSVVGFVVPEVEGIGDLRGQLPARRRK